MQFFAKNMSMVYVFFAHQAACPLPMQHIVHTACPCNMYWLHVHAICKCCMSFLHSMLCVHVRALCRCQCCMSMLHVISYASCPCCMSILTSLLHVLQWKPACPYNMSLLYDYAACPCCMSMLHAHTVSACPCHMPWCLSMLLVHAACPILLLNRNDKH